MAATLDRKSTRLNSSHGSIAYAVFCLKKKKLKELGERTDRMLTASMASLILFPPILELVFIWTFLSFPLNSKLFFFNDTATTEIYTLSLHDALPISSSRPRACASRGEHGREPSPAR